MIFIFAGLSPEREATEINKKGNNKHKFTLSFNSTWLNVILLYKRMILIPNKPTVSSM